MSIMALTAEGLVQASPPEARPSELALLRAEVNELRAVLGEIAATLDRQVYADLDPSKYAEGEQPTFPRDWHHHVTIPEVLRQRIEKALGAEV